MEYYNVRIYYYEHGNQYRVYSRPILKKSDNERNKKSNSKSRNNINKKERTEEEIERSKDVSLNRSKQNLIGICRANKWDYFITFTFNPRLVNSSNYEEVCKKAGQFMNNIKKRSCQNMKYILVPELHKNGERYHLHGLLSDCEGMRLLVSGKTDRSGNIIYNMPSWKYGFNTATEVSDNGKVSFYISKYLSKDTDGIIKGKRRYWCSRNVVYPKDICHELYIKNYNSVIEDLSYSGAIKHIKKSHVYKCNRDIIYIET